jgi:hypothetical protein
MWTKLIGLKTGTSGNPCEQGNRLSDYTEGGKYTDQLSD